MRKLIPILFALALAGCASIPNPLSTNNLATVEAAYGSALSIAVGYRDACAQRLIPSSCRPVVVKLQGYGARAQASIVAARNFIKANPTINASSLVSAAQNAVAALQSFEASNGVK